ncbi:hypothetical protein HYC85_029906 [Camellia sinensis]|uniref:Uncharacterized protein n=1 Tax=Camellia sinensis TaxID=4442 RepID=A0A7J7G017_CAMSI|nr:hypothetical protein HYC85_029906 [Camellia sinensis]
MNRSTLTGISPRALRTLTFNSQYKGSEILTRILHTRLVQYPELRCIHAISTYGASIQISSRGHASGYLNQTLAPEIPNLYVLGIRHSNSSFHLRSWSPRNSLRTQPRCLWQGMVLRESTFDRHSGLKQT